MNWFYIDESIQDGDRRKGPVSFEELRDLRKEEKIGDSTLVWHKGLDGWISWKEAFLSETEKHLQEDERVLKEAVDAILKERVEVKSAKSYAGFFVRGAAYIIDNVTVFLIGTLLFLLGEPLWERLFSIDFGAFETAAAPIFEQYFSKAIDISAFNEKLSEVPGFADIYTVFAGLLLIVQPVYFILFNGFLSATPGKLLFRLKIELADGSRIGFLGATLRYICSVLTQMTLVWLWGIGYIIAIIDPQKRAMHDFFAGTRVVHHPKVSVAVKKGKSEKD